MEDLESHKRGIDFVRLPRTLQDAIMMTRYLDLQYIWIDCLCIVQDDKLDWDREAGNMADTYSNSYLTIAAARASHSAEGFLGTRSTKIMSQISFSDEEGPFQLYFRGYDIRKDAHEHNRAVTTAILVCTPFLVNAGPWLRNDQNEPLSKRGWTL
jgi:hypothetical protein